MKFLLQLLLISGISLFVFSCRKHHESGDTLEIVQLKNSHLRMLEDNLQLFKNQSAVLNQAVGQFSTSLQLTHLNYSREQWGLTYDRFQHLGPFRLHVSDEMESLTGAMESRLGLYVINPAYLDVTAADATSGIIPDESTYPEIIYPTLLETNYLMNDPTKVSAGFHALEFLLWGEDLNPNGPGNRLVSAFGFSGLEGRRRTYLSICNVDLFTVIDDLSFDEYSSWFKNLNETGALRVMLSGAYRFVKHDFDERAVIGPMYSGSEVYEESPYSDHSLKDLTAKAAAIRNYLTGSQFDAVSDGYFLSDYIAFRSPEKHDQLMALLDAIDVAISDIPGTVDQAILTADGQAKLQTLHGHLESLSALLLEFARERGISSL